MTPELKNKLKKVRALLKREEAEAALIGFQSNFSWLSCGGEAHIPLNTNRTFGQLIVTPTELILFSNQIEMPRLEAEVVKGLEARSVQYNWFDGSALGALKKIANPKKILSDCGDFGTQARPELFAPLRYSLEPEEVKRYRGLGKLAEEAMTNACRKLEPGLNEFSLAGLVADGCWERNLTPIVLLVATDERIKRFRHPLPTGKTLKKHVMLVLCARRHGQIVAMTRIVHFGKLPEDLEHRHEAVCAVDAALIKATRPGAQVKDVFQRGLDAYEQHGFKDEWQLHHQGGPCGYEGRDYLGTPTAEGKVLENQPFAWNPSITGSKSEDTILATSKGPIVVTGSTDWPMITVHHDGTKMDRPAILVR